MINAFAAASDKPVHYEVPPGDLPEYYADPSLAKQLLGWESQHDIDRICAALDAGSR